MKKFNFQPFIILASAALFFAACNKSASNSSSTNGSQFATVSVSDGEAEDIYNNVSDNVMGTNAAVGIGTGGGVFGIKAPGAKLNSPMGGAYKGQHTIDGLDTAIGCLTVTVDSTPSIPDGFPITVTLDFGTSGCVGKDGHTRRGKIVTLYTEPLLETGSSAITTFDNYYVDTINVTGTHVITNISTGNTLIFNLTVQNGVLTAPSGNYIAFTRSRTWTQTAGQGSLNFLTYAFSITGNSVGTVSFAGGDSTYQWTSNIVSSNPLIRIIDCPWIEKGQEKITWNNLDGVIDFGSGSCDDQATVTVKGMTFPITLP